MSFATILRDAALYRLSSERMSENIADLDENGIERQWFSCNAVSPPEWHYNHIKDSEPARDWYTRTILDGGFAAWKIGEECRDESQNVRFMLLMFASYLAADEGL